MKVVFFSNRESRELGAKLAKDWSKFDVPELNLVKKVEVEEGSWITLGDSTLVISKDRVVPFIGDEALCSHFPGVLVDMGALKFVTNGAKVMRPGIRSFLGDFDPGDIVIVKDEKFKKAIAVCVAKVSRVDAEAMEKGPVLDNVHHVGDKFWEKYKEIQPQ